MIPTSQVSRQKLHGLLQKQSLYDHPFEDFDKQFSDEGARKELYQGLVNEGLYSKSAEDFDNQFFGDLKKKEYTIPGAITDVSSLPASGGLEEPSDLQKQIESSRQENIDNGGFKLEETPSLEIPKLSFDQPQIGIKDQIQNVLSEGLNEQRQKTNEEIAKTGSFNKLLKDIDTKTALSPQEPLTQTDLELNRQKVADDAAARERYMDFIDNGTSRAEHAVGTFDKTVIQSLASIPKGVETIWNAFNQKSNEVNRSLGLEGDDSNLERYKSTLLTEFGNSVQGWAEEFFSSNPKYQEEFVASTIPQAVGSLVAMGMTGGGLTKAALPALERSIIGDAAREFSKTTLTRPVASGSMMMAQSGFEQAKAAGLPDDKAFEVFMRDGLVGASEGVPIMNALNRMNKASGNGVINWLKSHAIGKIKGGTDEMVQEVFQGMMSNVTAAEYYDKTRLIFDGVFKDGAAGFVSGALFSGALHLVGDKGTPKDQRLHMKTYLKQKQNELFQKYGIDPAEQNLELKEEIGLADGNTESKPGSVSKENVGEGLAGVQEAAPQPVPSENLVQEEINNQGNASEIRSPIEEVSQGNIQETSREESGNDIQQPTQTGGEAGDQVQQINKEYESEIRKRLPDSLSSEEKQGALRGGEINAEATVITSAIHRAINESEGGGKDLLPRVKSEEESSLKNYAQEKGVWIEDKFGEPDTNGVEQDVYSNENGTVTKVNPNLTHDSWNEFFDRIAIHNALFPETAYTLKGFTEHNDLFSAVLNQNEIQKDGRVSFNDVKNELLKMGFEPIGKSKKLTSETTFVNKETGVELSDLHGENVIKGTDDKIYFIDPIIKKQNERGQGVSNNDQREASDSSGEESNTPEVQQEEPVDKGVVGEDNTGKETSFEWLGNTQKGTIVETLPDGRFKIKDSNGFTYRVSQDQISSANESAQPVKKTSEEVNKELNEITKTYQKKTNKPIKDNIAPINVNPLYVLKKVWTAFNKAQHLITESPVRAIDNWLSSKVKKGIEHNNYALRNTTGVAQNLIGGLAYTQGDLKNKLDFTGNKNYGHLRARLLSKDMYSLIDSDPSSLDNVHRALDPETWIRHTQQGETLIQERIKLNRKLFGYKGQLTTLEESSPQDIVKIDEVKNNIQDTIDAIDDKGDEIKSFQDKLQKDTLSYLNDQEKNLYDVIRSTNDFIHEWYHDQGLLTDDVYQKNKGKYIARLYEEFELADPEITQLVKSTRPDFNIFKQRKDFEDVGSTLIRDPIFATTKRLAEMLQTQAIFDYASDIVKSGIQVSDEQFPNSTQMGQPGKPFYGPLTGKFVPNYIAQDFKGFFFANQALQSMYQAFRGYDANVVRQFLKKLHTIYNPLVQLGNKISNYSFAIWAGVDPYTFTVNKFKAAKEISESGPYYQELVKGGIIGTDVLTNDLKPSTSEPGPLKKASDKASEYYGRADDEAKLASYISLREDYGYSQEEALQRTYNSFQNYATVGKLYDFAAKTPVIGNAYIKFKADLGRIIKNGVVNQPLTMGIYLGMLVYLKNLLSDLSDEEDIVQEIRERRSFIPKINTPFGDVAMVWQVPGIGEVNFARFLSPYYVYDKGDSNDMLNDITEWLPYQFEQAPLSMSKDVNVPVPELNDVLLGVWAQTVFDRDFRGKSIRDPKGTPFLTKEPDLDDQILNALSYIARSQIPLAPTYQDMMSAFNGEADYYGRERTIVQALLNNVIKVQEFGEEQARESLTKEIQYKVSKFESLSRDVSALKGASKREIMKINASDIPEDRKQVRIEEELKKFKKAVLNKVNQQVEIVKDLEDPAKLLKTLND